MYVELTLLVGHLYDSPYTTCLTMTRVIFFLSAVQISMRLLTFFACNNFYHSLDVFIHPQTDIGRAIPSRLSSKWLICQKTSAVVLTFS